MSFIIHPSINLGKIQFLIFNSLALSVIQVTIQKGSLKAYWFAVIHTLFKGSRTWQSLSTVIREIRFLVFVVFLRCADLLWCIQICVMMPERWFCFHRGLWVELEETCGLWMCCVRCENVCVPLILIHEHRQTLKTHCFLFSKTPLNSLVVRMVRQDNRASFLQMEAGRYKQKCVFLANQTPKRRIKTALDCVNLSYCAHSAQNWWGWGEVGWGPGSHHNQVLTKWRRKWFSVQLPTQIQEFSLVFLVLESWMSLFYEQKTSLC